MKNVMLVLLSSALLVGCAGARVHIPPVAMPKLPCAVVFEDKDEESGQELVGLMCTKAGLVKLVQDYRAVEAWQNDAWQKCGPKDGKAEKQK